MVVEFKYIHQFNDKEIFIFLGIPRGYTINGNFMVQFKSGIKEIEGEFNIDIWRTISAGNVLYKSISSKISKIYQFSKEDINKAFHYLIDEGFIKSVGVDYDKIYENIKDFTLLRQGQRFDAKDNVKNFTIFIDGENRELTFYKKHIWLLSNGDSSLESIFLKVSNALETENSDCDLEEECKRFAIALLICVKDRYVYLL